MKKIALVLLASFIGFPAFAQEAPTPAELNASANEIIGVLQGEHNVALQRISALAAENAKLKAKLEAANKPAADAKPGVK